MLTLIEMPLASFISLQTLQEALAVVGYPAVILFVMIESIGVPFPGETMLLLASFSAGVYHQLQPVPVIVCAALGAIIGDNIGYAIGRSGGRAFIERYGRYFFVKAEHLDKAEAFFVRHGGKTVFFGRFVTLLRLWAAFLAGVNRMPWRSFLLYNAAGGILWATLYGTLGYVAGRVLHDNFSQIQQIAHTIGWITSGGIVAIVVMLIVIIWWYKHRWSRRAIEQAPHEEEADRSNPVSL
jgi:membrane protein DedA with SNARE-associated domain